MSGAVTSGLGDKGTYSCTDGTDIVMTINSDDRVIPNQ